MAYQDFREFLDALRKNGELIDVDRAVPFLSQLTCSLDVLHEEGFPESTELGAVSLLKSRPQRVSTDYLLCGRYKKLIFTIWYLLFKIK